MAEVLGVAASAIQIADIGVKLSQNIYSYVETVANVDRRITEIGSKIGLTAAVITELGHVFDDPEVVSRSKASALATARCTLKQCEGIFKDVGEEIDKSRKYKLLFPFRTGKFDRLNANLESFKSTLSLLMHVLQHAQQLVTEKEVRKQVEELIRARDEAEERLRQRIPDENQQSIGGSTESSTPLQVEALPRQCHSIGMQTNDETVVGLVGITSGDPTDPHDIRQSRSVPLGVFTAADINFANVCASNSTVRDLPETESASSEDRTPEQILQRAQASMLEECLDSLKQIMFKIELLQQALPTTQSLPAWAKENKLAEASSGVKRNLDAVVGICERESEGPPLKRFAGPMEMNPSTSFAGVANPHPQPIIVQEEPVRQKIIVRREEPQYEIVERSEVDDRQVAKRPDPREDDYYYERRVREVDHGRGWEEDDYYARGRARIAERDWDSDEYREQSQHHPGTGPEGRNHHEHYKRGRSHSRGRKVAGIAALAAVGALACVARRVQKTDNTVIERRSRSRRRRHSGSGASCDEYSSSPSRSRSGSKHRDPEHRNWHIAQAGLASAAVTDLVERARSRSRSKSRKSRSRSLSRTGVPTAIAGLSGAAQVSLYEKNAAQSEDEDEITSRSRPWSRSKSKAPDPFGFQPQWQRSTAKADFDAAFAAFGSGKQFQERRSAGSYLNGSVGSASKFNREFPHIEYLGGDDDSEHGFDDDYNPADNDTDYPEAIQSPKRLSPVAATAKAEDTSEGCLPICPTINPSLPQTIRSIHASSSSASSATGLKEKDVNGEPPLFPAWSGDKVGATTAPLLLSTGTTPEHDALISQPIAKSGLVSGYSQPTREKYPWLSTTSKTTCASQRQKGPAISHEHDLLKQQTSLASGSVPGIGMSQSMSGSHNQVCRNSSIGLDNGWGAGLGDTDMDIGNSELPAFFFPQGESSQSEDFVDATATKEQPQQNVRFFPGIHQQQAALAKAQAQAQQQRQDQMLQHHTSAEKESQLPGVDSLGEFNTNSTPLPTIPSSETMENETGQVSIPPEKCSDTFPLPNSHDSAQDNFNGPSHWDFNVQNQGNDGGMAVHMAMKQALVDQLNHAAGNDGSCSDFRRSSRQSVSSYGADSPATPHNAQEDYFSNNDDRFRVPSNGETSFPRVEDEIDGCLQFPDNPDIQPVSKLDRTMTYIYADELFDPNTMVQAPTKQSAQSSDATLLSPFRSVMTDRLQAAHRARSQSPAASSSSRGVSPFRQEPQIQLASAKHVREQQNAHSDADAPHQSQRQPDIYVNLRVDGGSSASDADERAMGYRSVDGTYLAPLIGGFLNITVPVAEYGSSKVDALLREWTNVYDQSH